MIVSQFGFPEAAIKVLRDSGKPGEDLPTLANLKAGISWLAAGAKPGDQLMMHYSGHGGQVVDTNGDETDGYDGTEPIAALRSLAPQRASSPATTPLRATSSTIGTSVFTANLPPRPPWSATLI